jgi:hypothetical protein
MSNAMYRDLNAARKARKEASYGWDLYLYTKKGTRYVKPFEHSKIGIKDLDEALRVCNERYPDRKFEIVYKEAR